MQMYLWEYPPSDNKSMLRWFSLVHSSFVWALKNTTKSKTCLTLTKIKQRNKQTESSGKMSKKEQSGSQMLWIRY